MSPVDRRDLLRGAGGAALGSYLGLGATANTMAAARRTARSPNVLWIITDDQTRRMLGKMPKVWKRLVKKGSRFTRGYAAVPLCGPARASMLSSMYPHNHGATSNDTHRQFVARRHDQDTVATRIKRADYRTGYFGKYMNGSTPWPEYRAPGWDRWVALVDNRDQWIYNVDGDIREIHIPVDKFAAVHCEDFVRANVGQPWFAVFATTSPHHPATPSREHRHDFDGVVWDSPSFNERRMGDKPSWMQRTRFKDRYTMSRDYEGKLEELQDTDDQIADILDALYETGQLGDTFVFLVSDNGYLLGEHRVYRKEKPYEESAGVPFVVRGPGVPAGVPGAPVSQVDLMPTTLDIAGLDPDDGRALDGRSMLHGLTTGDWTEWRKRILVEHPRPNFEWAMYREGATVFVDHYARGERELYDLASDPYQMQSLARTTDTTAMAARLSAMRQAGGLGLRAMEE